MLYECCKRKPYACTYALAHFLMMCAQCISLSNFSTLSIIAEYAYVFVGTFGNQPSALAYIIMTGICLENYGFMSIIRNLYESTC